MAERFINGWIVALPSGHFNVQHPIDRNSHETDAVLGTQIVRRKTDEIPGIR
jgi:hypothetical protein